MPHVAEKELPSLAAQCWDWRVTGTMPWAGSCSTPLHPTHPTTLGCRLCTLFPPVRAVSAQCTKISVQTGLNGCCSGAEPTGCHFSLRLHGLCCKWMGFEFYGWATWSLWQTQASALWWCVKCQRPWLEVPPVFVCKLGAFKLFGLPGCRQWHSLKLFQLNALALIYNSTLTEFYFILSCVKYIVDESKGLIAD